MATAPPDTAPVIDRPVSIARLHGEACWFCGNVTKDLLPAGSITLLGGTCWPIVTCGCSPAAVTK